MKKKKHLKDNHEDKSSSASPNGELMAICADNNKVTENNKVAVIQTNDWTSHEETLSNDFNSSASSSSDGNTSTLDEHDNIVTNDQLAVDCLNVSWRINGTNEYTPTLTPFFIEANDKPEQSSLLEPNDEPEHPWKKIGNLALKTILVLSIISFIYRLLPEAQDKEYASELEDEEWTSPMVSDAEHAMDSRTEFLNSPSMKSVGNLAMNDGRKKNVYELLLWASPMISFVHIKKPATIFDAFSKSTRVPLQTILLTSCILFISSSIFFLYIYPCFKHKKSDYKNSWLEVFIKSFFVVVLFLLILILPEPEALMGYFRKIVKMVEIFTFLFSSSVLAFSNDWKKESQQRLQENKENLLSKLAVPLTILVVALIAVYVTNSEHWIFEIVEIVEIFSAE